MRIISGALRGREIRTPRGDATRPAMAKTREAVFSMLAAREALAPGICVLDLFAGSGSLAFEALSRGAAKAVLVDKSEDMIALAGATARDLGLEERIRLEAVDALRYLRKFRGRQFDLVFVDPPYRRDFVSPALAQLAAGDWLAPGACIVAELEKGASCELPAGLALQANRLFGQTEVHIWRKE